MVAILSRGDELKYYIVDDYNVYHETHMLYSITLLVNSNISFPKVNLLFSDQLSPIPRIPFLFNLLIHRVQTHQA